MKKIFIPLFLILSIQSYCQLTVSGINTIAGGGTNSSTANGALNNLLPNQSGQSGKVLSTDGTNAGWITGGGIGPTGPTGAQGIQGVTGATGSGGSSQWTTSGSNIYFNTGNVGIGTSVTPTEKFVLKGNFKFENRGDTNLFKIDTVTAIQAHKYLASGMGSATLRKFTYLTFGENSVRQPNMNAYTGIRMHNFGPNGFSFLTFYDVQDNAAFQISLNNEVDFEIKDGSLDSEDDNSFFSINKTTGKAGIDCNNVYPGLLTLSNTYDRQGNIWIWANKTNIICTADGSNLGDINGGDGAWGIRTGNGTNNLTDALNSFNIDLTIGAGYPGNEFTALQIRQSGEIWFNSILRLIPRSAPSSPTEGMIYSNSSDHHLYFYNGSTWKQIDN